MRVPIQSGQFASLSNGMRLHYASAGQQGKPLLLFVHGFPEFWYEWEAQLAEFGNDHYAVALDLRGFNLSDMPAGVADYKVRHIIEDLRLLAAHLGYEKFTMVAHDWGGAVAWSFALALPQLLHKLIIINAPHPWLFAQALAHDAQQQQASAYMNWLREEGAEVALAKDDFALLEGLFKDSTGWLNDEVRALYHACWSRGLHGGLNFYRASPLHPPLPGQPGPAALNLKPEDLCVKVPTRLIWGERDIALPKSLLDGIEAVVDDIVIERIPEGTHWVIHEQPARINALIRRFLHD
jgi:pimeloyl-ACP methyl ester carboxylesterase